MRLLLIPIIMVGFVVMVKTLVWIRQGHLLDFLVIMFIIGSIIVTIYFTGYAMKESKTWSK